MKHARVFTVFYCTSIVMMLIFLHGCAGTMHTSATQSVPTVTTETHTKVEQLVENPKTGVYEMEVVREEHTKTTVTTETHTKVEQLVENPETGVYEMKVVREEHTKTQPPMPPRTPNAHTTHGHSAGKTDWGFYALNVLIIAVKLYMLMSD